MEWYYAKDDDQLGPIGQDEFEGLVSRGEIVGATLVWHDGMADWQPYGEVAGSAALPAGAPPPALKAPVRPAPGEAKTTRSNTQALAVASLVLGFVALTGFSCLGSVPGIVLGHVALAKIKNAEEPLPGRGLAIAGLVINYAITIITLLAVIFVIFGIALSGPQIAG